MRLFKTGLVVICLAGLAMGCSTVQRVDTDTVTDLSGNWNDTDSRLVAEEMITDVTARPWLGDFMSAHGGKKPTVIVGAVVNRSDEHINTQTFTKNLEMLLLNSGKVSFVSSREERAEVRDEREDQQVNASAETVKKMRNEQGADFMLKGSINTITDAKGGEKAKYYQVNLELHDMETNNKVWIGEKQIKKVIKRGMFRG